MKKKLLLPLALGLCLFACKSHQAKSEDDLDAARNFLKAALDGQFDNAQNYMIRDSTNLGYLDAARRKYDPKYKGSAITVYEVTPLNDSASIVIYSNSFKNDKDTLKVLKIKDQWLVDLKYLYQQGMDSVKPIIINDSIKK
jgi:hypothetical protein